MKDLDVVQQMDLPQISKTLELLRTAMWLDGDLLRAVARRAVDVLEARGLVGAFPRGLDELLSRFAYFGHEPLGEDCRCRLVEAVMRAADEVDLKHTHQITRLARAAAILGRPELAEGRVRRLYMEQIESLAGKQEMSGPGDDREKALSALQQWFLGRGLSEPPAQADLDELAVAARETFVIASSRLVHQQASALQTFVIRAARKAERNFAGNAFALNPAFADPEQVSEHVLDNGISIDCAFPGYLLAIEADGPAHFFWNRPDVPNGRTVFKHQLLRHEGWLVVSISATDWYNHYREGWGERLRFREETALIARRVREEDEKSEHSSSARFQGLVSAREAVIFETSTEEYQKRRPVQEETAPDEAKQDRSKPDMSQILAAQQQQTELSAAEKMRAENRSQADEQRRERGERAEEARAALQRQRADAAKQKRQLREQQSEAEKQSVQLLVSQRESLEGDFGSSLDRDWSWESDCLDNPLEHDLVSVYVLGVSSGHPGSAAQLWAVLEEVGWDNAQVVFGCGRLTYQEFEEQKDGVWYDCRSRVRLEARLAKERSYSDARNNHPKGSRNQKRAQLEAGDMELPQFWCCAPSVLDLWEPWLKARAPSKADEDQWRMSSGENLHIVEVISDALSSGPKAQLDNDAKIQYTLRGLAEQRRQRTVDDAVSIYQRYEADHAGEGPSEGSLLALVHAAVAAEDGGEPDAVVERITRLAQAGVSVEDSRREQQLRDMEATPSSLPHRAFSPGHIAAAVQEVVIPEVLLKFDSLKEQQRGHRKSTTVTEKNAPAIVMVVEDSDYHSMRQLMADPEAWAEPQPLPVRCELRTSALQQLLDVGIRPHVRALESLFDDPTNTFREEWKQIWSARMEEDGRSDLIEAVYENVDRAMDDGPGFIEEAFTINEHGQLRARFSTDFRLTFD